MRIKINKKLCVGCEVCVNICPDVFRMWGEFLKADFEVAEPQRFNDPILKAIDACPAAAISIES